MGPRYGTSTVGVRPSISHGVRNMHGRQIKSVKSLGSTNGKASSQPLQFWSKAMLCTARNDSTFEK